MNQTGFLLAGVVAGEGWYSITTKAKPRAGGQPRRRFVFGVTMASRDRALLVALRSFLTVGSIVDRAPVRAHWQPTSTFSISSMKAHREITVPFSLRFLSPSAKRDQFLAWQDALHDYMETHGVRIGLGPSMCKIDGCEEPVRGRGLCRSHYYQATGY